MAQIKQETIDEIFDLGRDIEETVNGVRELCHGKFPDKIVESIEVAVKQLTTARAALWLMLKERGLSTSEIAELALSKTLKSPWYCSRAACKICPASQRSKGDLT